MAYQSEAELELQFIDQLNKQGYSTVSVPDYDALVENFKVQFEAFNADKLDKPLTDKEWERILNLMLGKSVFQSAKILRDKFVLEREDGTKVYLLLKRRWLAHRRFGRLFRQMPFYRNSYSTSFKLSNFFELPTSAQVQRCREQNGLILKKLSSLSLILLFSVK